jgi:amidohydrolase
MHACGHDIHTSIALGAAMVLANVKDKIKGNVKFIFQPSEEGAPAGEEGGAELMIKEGVLEDPTVGAIFGLHVWPRPWARSCSAGESWPVRPLNYGQGSSAHGAAPRADAVVIAAEVVTAQTVVSRSLDLTTPPSTIGKIEGGVRSNIIAEKVTLEGTVRCLSEANRKKIPQLMESLVKNITAGYGASSTFDYRPSNPSVYNNPELAQTMLPTLVRVLGRDRVQEFKPQLVAEDFAYYAQRIPGFFFFLGARTPGQPSAPLHSPTFNPDERSVAVGIRCAILPDALEAGVPAGDGSV